MAEENMRNEKRCAEEAGWRLSRYNLMAGIPDSDHTAIVNLFKRTYVELNPSEMSLLSNLAGLYEDDPNIARLAKLGIVCNFDEVAALEVMGHAGCASPKRVNLTICPTLACNLDCPYCFEDRRQGKMGPEVQDDVVALAKRLMDASGASNLAVKWFGGEPLLALDVIESLSARLMELVRKREGRYAAFIDTNGYLLDQDAVDLLARAKVARARITLDGVGNSHDATRHLAGGGPTFERIVRNLSECRIPFPVVVRHNVHEGNKGQIEALRDYIGKLAEESGNWLRYFPAPVVGNEASERRGSQITPLRGSCANALNIKRATRKPRNSGGYHCGAQMAWFVVVDERGSLYKCPETVGKQDLSFGTAHDWNPSDALGTAARPENLLQFLYSVAETFDDDECRDCALLPLCTGGCPYYRLAGKHVCPSFKEDSESYVLAMRVAQGQAGRNGGFGAVVE